MKNIIDIGINSPYDLGQFNKNINEDTIKILKKIKSTSVLYKSDLDNREKYDVVILDSRLEKNNFSSTNSDLELIYEIKNTGDSLKLFTGKYIGNIITDGVSIRINSGYSKFFTQRLLNFANKLYFDNSAKLGNEDENDELSILIQYLFLTTLKRASILGFPKEYQTITKKDFNIKGSIDINLYLKNVKNLYNGINYSYRERKYNQDILNTLYSAFLLCSKEYVTSSFKEINQLFSDVKDVITDNHVNSIVISNAKNSPVLNNQMYVLYKKVLIYAEMIIKHKGFLPIPDDNKKIANGWLIDVADLWELYLYQLIKVNFPNWDVLYQDELPIYKSLFFGRNFMPDIIMKRNNEIVIMDAKFKKMDFNENGNDVDRADLQQIHTYYAYYQANGYNVKYTTLIYPTRENPPETKKLISSMFESKLDSKFGISYMVVSDNKDDQVANEISFIERLRNIIEN